MLSHVQRERSLTHRRSGRDNNQLTFVEPGRHLVQFAKAGADSPNTLARVEKDIQTAFEIANDLPGVDQRLTRASLAQLQQCFFGVPEDLVRLLLRRQRSVDQLLCRKDDAPENRLILDDSNVGFQREDLRKTVVQLN